jgi:hypothetical protein
VGVFDLLKKSLEEMNKVHFSIWLLVSIGATLILTPQSWYPGSAALYELSSAINYISWAFVNGIPIFLGAGIFLTSKESRKAQVSRSVNENTTAAFMHQFFLYEILISFYIAAFTFSVLTISATSFQGDASIIYSAIPLVMLCAVLTTMLLSSIATLFAIVFDDWRLTTIAGLVPLFLISYNMGFPGNPSTYREIALLSPVHYFKGLVFVLGGYENQRFFRLYFEFAAMLIPTLVFCSIAFVLLYGAHRIYKTNINRWILESEQYDAHDFELQQGNHIFLDTDTQVNNLEVMQVNLKKRRRIALALLISFIIITNIAIPSYTQARSDADRVFVYQSPEGSESIELGQWINRSFMAEMPQDPGLYCNFIFVFEVLSWRTNLTRLKFVYGCQSMSMAEFQQLNETELELIFNQVNFLNSEYPKEGGVSSIDGGPEFVWAMRFMDSERNFGTGELVISLTMWTEIHRW